MNTAHTDFYLHKSQKGQALIELLASLSLWSGLTIALLQISYCQITYFWVDHYAYQFTLCLASERQTKSCKTQFQNHIHFFLHKSLVTFQKHESFIKTKIQYQLGVVPWSFQIKKNIRL